MHFFIAYQDRTYTAKTGAIDIRESTFFLLSQICFDLGFEQYLGVMIYDHERSVYY